MFLFLNAQYIMYPVLIWYEYMCVYTGSNKGEKVNEGGVCVFS